GRRRADWLARGRSAPQPARRAIRRIPPRWSESGSSEKAARWQDQVGPAQRVRSLGLGLRDHLGSDATRSRVLCLVGCAEQRAQGGGYRCLQLNQVVATLEDRHEASGGL